MRKIDPHDERILEISIYYHMENEDYESALRVLET